MINNSGKTAVIFGIRNDSSIAFNIAKTLHESGCAIAVNYLPDSKDDVLQTLENHGISTEYAFEVDVRDEPAIKTFIKSVYDKTGSIDYILHGVAYGNHNVMCSSMPGSQSEPPSYLDIPFEDLMDSFNISAYSLLRICRVAEPFLTPDASIVTLSYNASQKIFSGYAGMSINKAALENIVLYLSECFGPKGIRVNSISAGLVMTTSAGGIKGVRSLRKIGKKTAPLGNIKSQDVANAALYYFSDLSLKVTGNNHYVDGGLNIMGVTVNDK